MHSVLIIENDDAVRDVVREILSAAGYTVREASNGRLGIHAFRKAPTDLVITDLYMPDRDGLEVIEAFRRTHPRVKILAISGASGSMGYFGLAQSLGAVAVLPKPFAPATLVTLVAELLKPEGTGPEPFAQ